MESLPLPDYERAPVVEVVAAVQFVPLAQFGMREAVAVAREFSDWEIVDMPPALEPIVEPAPGQPIATSLRFGLGMPPVRLIMQSPDARWVAQIQQDRVAAHERRIRDRPSFRNVEPQLNVVTQRASGPLGRDLLDDSHSPELVEVIYENRIPAGEGWAGFSELHHVLRALAPAAGEPPFGAVEQASLGFAYALTEAGEFRGRLRVTAEPTLEQDGRESLHLRLISRRFVHNRPLDVVLEECHADIVRGFTAITTERMHEVWGRYR